MKSIKKGYPSTSSICRKITAVFIIGLLLMLIGCGGQTDNGLNTSSDATETGDINTDALKLFADGVSDYVIVRADGASKAEIEAAILLRDAIKAFSGISLTLKDDFVNDRTPAASHEILIGRTKRDESIEVTSSLKYGDYAVSIKAEKLVITGGSDAATLEAVNAFIEKYLSGTADNLTFTPEMCFDFRTEYPLSVLKINDVDISEFVIVRSNSGNDSVSYAVEQLRTAILNLCGVNLEVVNDIKKPAAHELIVGNTLRGGKIPDSGSVFLSTDGGILIAGADSYSTRQAVSAFIEKYLSEENKSETERNIKISEEKIPAARMRSVMSFNILCYVTKSETPQRADLVVAEILKYMPDSVGLQEVSADWLPILVSGLGEYYDYVGESNKPDGQNWRNAIFYRRDKLKVLDTQTRWLSATPTKVSKVSASNQYRIVTWAVFEDLETGEVYAHFNTHIDYEEDARAPQVKVLTELLNKCDYPIVLTGDFNFAQTYKNYYQTIVSGKMYDSKYAAVEYDPSPTCGSSVIDYCFVTLDTVNVFKQKVITDKDASDHNAVFTEFSLIK